MTPKLSGLAFLYFPLKNIKRRNPPHKHKKHFEMSSFETSNDPFRAPPHLPYGTFATRSVNLSLITFHVPTCRFFPFIFVTCRLSLVKYNNSPLIIFNNLRV